MSELRLNLITREWVIIAKERALRPEDFKRTTERPKLAQHVADCPFCPGNEKTTPPEQFRVQGDEDWKIRVVNNKYPALSSTGEKHRTRKGNWRIVTGVGQHYVIIETPAHNMSPALLPKKHVSSIIRTYRDMFISAYRDPRVEHVIVFRNHGRAAGTSLEHPHSQLIATPIVPVQFRDRIQAAQYYYDDTGKCLSCDMMENELSDRVRIICESDHFLTFVPFAALSPFHTWIFPKRHSASFADITVNEINDLAHHLKTVLAKFHNGLNDPDYNYVIRSSRPMDAGNEYCHWYLSIVPRLTTPAGFEMGSGMYINTSVPEESAAYMRSVKPIS